LKTIDRYGQPLFVIGNPVEHTISPPIHNRAFQVAELPHRYFALQVEAGELGRLVDLLIDLDSPGVNVTLPHKESICSVISNKSSEVKRLGAANTVYRRRGELRLANTDVYGFSKLAAPWEEEARRGGVLLLGAGGAARACLLAFEQMGCEKVTIYDEVKKKAARMEEEFRELQIDVIDKPELDKGGFEARVVVNATPVGLEEGEPSVLPEKVIEPDMVGIDLIYNRRTKFLELFEAKGCPNCGGLDMLVYQAARSWELWTDRQPPVEAMFEAAREAVGT